MMKLRQRRTRERSEATLDVTAFMNLMIVLVPVLLVNMVFTHTGVIDLQLPSGTSSLSDIVPQKLEVIVHKTELVVSDTIAGVIRVVPSEDYQQLRATMIELKRRAPDVRDITVLLQADTPYQTLVSVLDHVRAYPTLQDGELVQAELFPDIALGDAPAFPNDAAGLPNDAARPAGTTKERS